MIAIVVVFLLAVGALSTFIIPERYRSAHILLALIPLAAAGALLLPLRLSNSITLPWAPASLFPNPLVFRAGTSAKTVAVYFCFLLTLIIWTRPLRCGTSRVSRLLSYLLTLAGVSSGFASSPLAVIVLWSLIDFLSFAAIVFLKNPVEIESTGVSTPLVHSISGLAINMLGNILVIFSIFAGSGGGASWEAVWNNSAFAIGPVFFLVGILLRILISPLSVGFSRIRTESAGTELLLRIVPSAAALALLSAIWPVDGFYGFAWALLPLAILLLVVSLRWAISASPFIRRDIFFSILPGFAMLSAIACPRAGSVFLAAEGMLILGGGVLLLYTGFLVQRRWLAVFPLVLGMLISGVPFTPFSVWSGSVYPGLLSAGTPFLSLPLFFIQVLVFCAVIRSALEPVEEFPPNEPAFLIVFSAGMIAALLALLLPGWGGVSSIGSAVMPGLVLGLGAILFFLVRRFHRVGSSAYRILETFTRLDWLRRSADFGFRQAAVFVSWSEAFLSGDGAMFWSLGIALLLYLVFRGG